MIRSDCLEFTKRRLIIPSKEALGKSAIPVFPVPGLVVGYGVMLSYPEII